MITRKIRLKLINRKYVPVRVSHKYIISENIIYDSLQNISHTVFRNYGKNSNPYSKFSKTTCGQFYSGNDIWIGQSAFREFPLEMFANRMTA